MQASQLYSFLIFFLFHLLAETSTPDAGDLATQVVTFADNYTEMENEENGLSGTPPPFFEDNPSSDNDGQAEIHIVCMFGLQGDLIAAVNNTLYDVRKYDPLLLGKIPDQYLTEGTLEGLSSFRNISDLEIVCKNNMVLFTVQIRIDNPYIRYQWEKRVMFLFRGSLWLRADTAEVKLVVEMDGDFKLNLKRAKITKLSGFNFGFSGLGPLNPFVSLTVNLLEKIWKTKVVGKLEKIMQSELQKEITKLKIL